MEDDIINIPNIEPNTTQTPNLDTTLDEKNKIINELEIQMKNIQFYSDPIRFNSIVYQGISLIIEKLAVIESKLGIKNETN